MLPTFELPILKSKNAVLVSGSFGLRSFQLIDDVRELVVKADDRNMEADLD